MAACSSGWLTETVTEAEKKVHTAEAKARAALDAATVYLGGAESTPSLLDEAEEGVTNAAQVVAETQQFLRKTMAETAWAGKGGDGAAGQQIQKLQELLRPIASKLNAQKAKVRSLQAELKAKAKC